MSVTASTPAAGIGPAIAMVDAVYRGHVADLRIFAQTFAVDELAASVAELTRRLLVKAEIATDDESLWNLSNEVLRVRVLCGLDIRLIDRVYPWTSAQIAGKRFLRTMAAHYLDAVNDALDMGDELEVEQIPEFSFPIRDRSISDLDWVRGLAYAATWLLAEMASYDEYDVADAIDGYRAFAASDMAETR
tara:strand:+ start:332 stop:901 length:570 start_codon:yes stop_codon:yes gene_type:complete